MADTEIIQTPGSVQRQTPQLLTPDQPDGPLFEVLQEIGRGGLSAVYKARQASLNRVVALKTWIGSESADSPVRARFQLQAEILGQLQHPHIPETYDALAMNGQLYLVLEFVGGGTLDQQLQDGPLPPPRAVALGETLARTVHHIHQCGVLHRNLKPRVVLLKADGTPKLTGFGLSKWLNPGAGRPDLDEDGAVMGTPSYMAPEQASGQLHLLGPATDIYGLGALLYQLLTGRPPFRGETALDTLQQVMEGELVPPRQLQPGIPRKLEAICLKCLHKDPGKRYGSAAELAEELRRSG
jgi:serine/threonine protein kinase